MVNSSPIPVWPRTVARCLRRLPPCRGAGRLASAALPSKRFEPAQAEELILDGSRIRVWPVSHIGWHLYCHGTYEPRLRAIMRRQVSQGNVVVEVGANIGWHTLLLSRLVGPTGEVHAFEPNFEVNEELRYNLSLNTASNVQVYDCGLSSEAGVVQFVQSAVNSPTAGDGHIASSGELHEQAPEVQLKALDEVGALRRVDFIKVDVEGHEGEVLAGGMSLIEQFRPVIAFEIIPEFRDRQGGAMAKALSRLEEMDYRFSSVEGGRRMDGAALETYSGNLLASPRRPL